jgi:hypothetical protein
VGHDGTIPIKQISRIVLGTKVRFHQAPTEGLAADQVRRFD